MPSRIFSGMQPTGVLHLGSYYGALQNWVRLQDRYECIYCIVDQHALTVDYEPAALQERVITLACLYLAAGVDPAKSILFVQSHVPQHTELAWYFSSIVSLGQLERMTQFKDKAEQHGGANLGLLAYPVLQAADILICRADAVPVGEDQSQHLELTRDIAQRFNYRFAAVFPEPQTLLTPGKRILALDNSGKMSKTKPDSTSIFMTDDPEMLWAKLRVATTDPARKRRTDPGDPAKCPVGVMHRAVSSPEDNAWVYEGCTTAGIGCIDCKRKLAENIEAHMKPIRERYFALRGEPETVRAILAHGAARAGAIAEQTMAEVRAIMGLR